MISVIILAKNEENNIKSCIERLLWCDEIIVIDDNSIDKTKEIAIKMKATIINHPLIDDFAAQRNFGLGKAKGEWVMFIDADERVSNDLEKEIKDIINKYNDDISGIIIKRKDYIFNKWLKHGESSDIKLLRIGKKNGGIWKRKVHEYWDVKGKNIILSNFLLHYPHQKMTDFLKEINFYSSLNAKQFFNQGKRVGLIQIISYPLAKFFTNYFIKLGFLDKTEGFIHAMMMSLHSFLTRVKIWQLQNAK